MFYLKVALYQFNHHDPFSDICALVVHHPLVNFLLVDHRLQVDYLLWDLLRVLRFHRDLPKVLLISLNMGTRTLTMKLLHLLLELVTK